MTNFTETTFTFQTKSNVNDLKLVLSKSLVLICLAATSCFGNFVVCFTLIRRQYLLTPSNKLILNLTISNFVLSIVIFPFLIISSIQGRWFFGKLLCSIFGYFTITIFGASMLTLAMVSIDRYYAVVHPLQYSSIITSCRIKCMIAFCWIFCSLLSLPPLFGLWSYFQYNSPEIGCMPVWQHSPVFSLIWITLCILLPYSIMLASYSYIFCVARSKANHLISFKRHSSSKLNAAFSDDKISCKINQEQPSSVNVFQTSVRIHSGNANNPKISVDQGKYSASSNVLDSGLASSSYDDLTILENLPHQVDQIIEEIPQSFSKQTNLLATSQTSSNNNVNFSQQYRHDPIISSRKQNQSLDISPNTDPYQTPTDSGVSHLAPPVSRHRSSPSPFMRRSSFALRAKSLSLQESSSPPLHTPTLSKHSSSGTLNSYKKSPDMSMFYPISRNASRISNLSKFSVRSFASNRSKVSFTIANYYNNQRKALCTISCILGLLLLCFIPFVLRIFHEVVSTLNKDSSSNPTDDWIISCTTLLLYFTCVYHPLIYGLWNRAVRREMKSVFCGVARSPVTRRSRVLSLTSHLKDLGLSPRLTAAIMLESAAAATVARPMKLTEKPLRKHSTRVCMETNSISTGGKCTKNRIKLKKVKCLKRALTEPSPIPTNHNAGISSCGARHSDVNVEVCSSSFEQGNGSVAACASNHKSFNTGMRTREKPLFNLPDIKTSELIQNSILSSAVLFSDSNSDLLTNSYLHNNEPCCSASRPRNSAVIKPVSLLTNQSCASVKNQRFNDENLSSTHTSTDVIANLTKNKLRSKDLLHLHTDEPIKFKEWNKEEKIDFFAQSFAYSLIEDLNL